jgi:hypothetical protein
MALFRATGIAAEQSENGTLLDPLLQDSQLPHSVNHTCSMIPAPDLLPLSVLIIWE